jgi:hypothetical protein
MTDRPTRVQILEQGVAVTAGDRDRAYGPPYQNFNACAKLWEAYLMAKTHGAANVRITAEDVAHMMTLLKMARTFHGGYHEDNYIDSATYEAIAGECRKISVGEP